MYFGAASNVGVDAAGPPFAIEFICKSKASTSRNARRGQEAKRAQLDVAHPLLADAYSPMRLEGSVGAGGACAHSLFRILTISHFFDALTR